MGRPRGRAGWVGVPPAVTPGRGVLGSSACRPSSPASASVVTWRLPSMDVCLPLSSGPQAWDTPHHGDFIFNPTCRTDPVSEPGHVLRYSGYGLQHVLSGGAAQLRTERPVVSRSPKAGPSWRWRPWSWGSAAARRPEGMSSGHVGPRENPASPSARPWTVPRASHRPSPQSRSPERSVRPGGAVLGGPRACGWGHGAPRRCVPAPAHGRHPLASTPLR